MSTQILADQCNPFGTLMSRNDGAEQTWVGSPLRVQRRCSDLMFSIANEIAYDNKMIFGNTDPAKRQAPKKDLYLGESSWVNVSGRAILGQFVQEQANLVIQMLQKIVKNTKCLPDLYIVTPFKRIENELICRIKDSLNKQLYNDPSLWNLGGKVDEWCRKRIGTVHTFQGKEEKIVWMVLGCDKQTNSVAQWAAGKPNLLNVALTRAKHHVFIIGDKSIWAAKKNFCVAAEKLPEIDDNGFIARLSFLIWGAEVSCRLTWQPNNLLSA